MGDEAAALEFERHAVAAEAWHGLHPPEPLSETQRHDLALATVFTLVVALYSAGLKTLTESELDRVTEGLAARGQHERATALARKATEPEAARYIVQRRRSDAQIEAFVEGLATETTRMFGRPFYGVIATLTNVAFERSNFDRQRIRAILKIR